jgi:glycosyltransferase involved in cell wall biosynthesis
VLSVVIPARDCADTIGEQLEALADQRYDGEWEVIVADNGSTDDLHEQVARYRGRLPGLRIVPAGERRGSGYARNVGALAATGGSLAFCDADDIVGAGWLPAMARDLAEHDLVATPCETERLNDPAIRRTRRAGIPGERLPYPPYLPHAGGSGLAVKRELFHALGGFDETLPRLQDTDFCIRAQLAGTSLHYLTDAVIHVRFKRAFAEIFRQGREYGEGNARLQARYASGLRSTRGWWKWPFRHWRAIGRALLHVYDRGARAQLAWVLGWQVGRMYGTVRYRVPAT